MKNMSIISTRKDNIMKQRHFLRNKKKIMMHVLKVQQISLLPKYIKWISRGVFFTCVHVCKQRLFVF